MSVDYLEWLGGLFEKPRAARDNVLELQKPYPISCRRIYRYTHARTENVEQVKHVYILCACVCV